MTELERYKYDVLVIGAGGAGLRAHARRLGRPPRHAGAARRSRRDRSLSRGDSRARRAELLRPAAFRL